MYGSNFGTYVPNIARLSAKFGVNLTTWESLRWSLYDSAAYPAAGVAKLQFFQVANGAGTGFSGGPKTESDTNMTLNGQLPMNQKFLCCDIEVLFQPTTPDVAGDNPAEYGAPQTANIVNDEWTFRRTGNLAFVIGSKSYIQDAPLWVFPSKQNFEISTALADASSYGPSMQSRIAHGFVKGPVYSLGSTPIALDNNQNFNVILSWPEGIQAIVNPARVFVRLNGWLYRTAQ
jgi:hypothetical protein